MKKGMARDTAELSLNALIIPNDFYQQISNLMTEHYRQYAKGEYWRAYEIGYQLSLYAKIRQVLEGGVVLPFIAETEKGLFM